MASESDKLLYTDAVKWINENPNDKRIADEIKQDFLRFDTLSPENKTKLVLDLNNLLATNGLPKAVERSLPWLTFALAALPNPVLSEMKEHLNTSDRKKLGSISKRMHSIFQLSKGTLEKFLQRVAYGEQEQAESLFTNVYQANGERIQKALLHRGRFTDYSGRTFNCSAYEYAYWAKDTHMCRMLERYMDDDTKAAMAARIDEIERIDKTTGQPVGLVYSQAGQEHRSAHFDFTPLKEAYQRFLNGFDAWDAARNFPALNAAWWDVGQAQRNVPAHVAQEYCRPGRSFGPSLEFNEATLPRVLAIYNWATNRKELWFPLIASTSSGLGFDFAIISDENGVRARSGQRGRTGGADNLAAVIRLDEVRTGELTQLRQQLSPPAISSMSV